MSMECIGEPISWLRLERYALGELECSAVSEIEEHIQACPACRLCLAEVKAGVYESLPPLASARTPASEGRWQWILSWRNLPLGMALALMVAVAPGILSEKDAQLSQQITPGVKGNEMVNILIRERSGTLVEGPQSFREGDRFKWLVTCAPPQVIGYDMVVFQGEERFFPIESGRIRCQNRNPVPGAFSLTGTQPAVVCLSKGGLGRDRMKTSEDMMRSSDSYCVPLSPEVE